MCVYICDVIGLQKPRWTVAGTDSSSSFQALVYTACLSAGSAEMWATEA